MTAAGAKATILQRIKSQGLSGGYGELLCLIALMESDPEDLTPESEEERHEWRGHFSGLRAALACLAMYELNIGPEPAADIINEHITQAVSDMTGKTR